VSHTYCFLCSMSFDGSYAEKGSVFVEKHQVIIVGAGPAGATCAKALHDRGIDVLVIDRARFPRHKTCSGILFGQTQVLLQNYFGCLPPESVYCSQPMINASAIREWKPEQGYSDYVWEIAKDGQAFPDAYHNIRRADFDHWLIAQSGAELRDGCSVRAVRSAHDGVQITVRCDGRESELACEYMIGADGGNSTVRKLLDPRWAVESPTVLAYQTYTYFQSRGELPEDQWTVFFKPEIGDILSCVHQKDDTLVLCVGGFKGRSLKKSMQAFKEFLSREFHVVFGSQQRDEGCLIRMAPPHFGQERVVLAGEAGGFIYLNGEGISAAMDTGYRAAVAVVGALGDGGSALDRYQAGSADIVAHMQTCMQQLHFLCASPSA
jgi:flavin-dependent dehydrogenase